MSNVHKSISKKTCSLIPSASITAPKYHTSSKSITTGKYHTSPSSLTSPKSVTTGKYHISPSSLTSPKSVSTPKYHTSSKYHTSPSSLTSPKSPTSPIKFKGKPSAYVSLDELEIKFLPAEKVGIYRSIKVDEVESWKVVQNTIRRVKADHFKRKITGMIIIAFLILLVVPLIFPDRYTIAFQMLQTLLALFSGFAIQRNI